MYVPQVSQRVTCVSAQVEGALAVGFSGVVGVRNLVVGDSEDSGERESVGGCRKRGRGRGQQEGGGKRLRTLQ